jgi:hypothetical protein
MPLTTVAATVIVAMKLPRCMLTTLAAAAVVVLQFLIPCLNSMHLLLVVAKTKVKMPQILKGRRQYEGQNAKAEAQSPM